MNFQNRKFFTVVSGILLFISLLGWSLSDPPYSGFDSLIHISTVLCIRGEEPGICENLKRTANGVTAEIPNLGPATKMDSPMISVGIIDKNSQNLFYYFMNIFASKNITQSVFIMRLFNILLASLIFSFLISITSNRVRLAVLGSWLVTISPILVSTIYQVSPRSWSYLAAMSSWAFLYNALTSHTKKSKSGKLSWLLFGISCLLAFSSRWDGTIIVIFTTLITFLGLQLRLRKLNLRKALWVFLISGIIYFLILQSRASTLINIKYLNNPSSDRSLLFHIMHLPESYTAAFGLGTRYNEIGPNSVGIIFFLVFILFLSQILRTSNLAQILTFVITMIFGALSMLRLIVWGDDFYGVAGVYIAGLFTFLIGALIIFSDQESFDFEKKSFRYTLISLVSTGHAVTLYSNYEWSVRQSVLNDTYSQLSLNGGWWWSLPVSPNLVYLVTISAFTGWLVCSWKVHDYELGATRTLTSRKP